MYEVLCSNFSRTTDNDIASRNEAFSPDDLIDLLLNSLSSEVMNLGTDSLLELSELVGWIDNGIGVFLGEISLDNLNRDGCVYRAD